MSDEKRVIVLKEFEIIDASGSAVSVIAESFEEIGKDYHFHTDDSLVSIVENAQRKPRRIK